MRDFRSIWGGLLCLGMTGCAVTNHCAVHGPGVCTPGVNPVLAVRHHHHPQQPYGPNGCGQVLLPIAPSMPMVPSAVTETTTLARFFPLLHEREGTPADPHAIVRPDPLGVRTTSHGVLIRSDGQMVRASAEVPNANLPLVVQIGTPLDPVPPEPVATAEVVEPSPSPPDPAPMPMPEGGAGELPVPVEESPNPAPQPPGQVLPQPSVASPLEYAPDPSLAGRPRLAQDGTLIPGPRVEGAPAYGPEPTFPASYAAGGSAPKSVPKNREIWPTRRPSMLSRIFQRFRGS